MANDTTDRPSPAGEPAMPDVDKRMQIPYESIRYIAGYTEEYVKQYARAYGQAVAEHARRAAMDEAAKAIEDLRDSHCADTKSDQDNNVEACTPTCNHCDFVVAWNDSIQIIRAAAQRKGETA